MDLSGEEFRLLLNFWSEVSLNQRYKRGVSSKTSVSKIMCSSLNPPKSVDKFRNFLLDEGVLVFNRDGLIVLDDDKFLSLVRSNKTYCAVKAFISDNDSTIFVE